MASKKQQQPVEPESEATVDDATPDSVPDAGTGTVRIYPTHRRGDGPLVVALPSVEGDSAELVITDDGADVNPALGDQLIAAREATTDAPTA